MDSLIGNREVNNMDNWKHRSNEMKCRTCMWYVEKKDDRVGMCVPSDVKTEKIIVGRCRRHAPTMGGFPVVFPEDWCGDHRVDETKVGFRVIE